MNPVDIVVPGGEVLYNSLYEDQPPETLAQDIVAIRLQDGTFIDVSWHPQFDPNGAYTVAHISADWERHLSEMRTRQVAKVVETIHRMACGDFFQVDRPIAKANGIGNPHTPCVTRDWSIRYRSTSEKATVYA